MKPFYRHLTAAVSLLVFDLAMAQSSLPDWRLYSFSKEPNAQAVFFLYSEIVRVPKGHVQVWVKLISRAKLEETAHAAITEHPEFMQRAKDKEASYVPPYTRVRSLSPEEVVSVRIYEQIADAASIPPTVRALYEIDCDQKLYRQLSAIAEEASRNEAAAWAHVPPESTVEILSTLTCQR